MNDDIERPLRLKREKRTMVDGTYTVRAYWGVDRKWSYKTILVRGGVAYDMQAHPFDVATQVWLRDNHIPTTL